MMNMNRNTCLLLGSLALAGCSSTHQAPPTDNVASNARAPGQTDAKKDNATPRQPKTDSAKPNPVATTRASTFEASVRGIDHKNRKVTFLLADGKRATVNIGARAGDISNLQIGDHVVFELAETVEIIENGFHPETGALIEEHPAGSTKERESYNPFYTQDTHASSKIHHVSWTEVIDIPARIASISIETHTITLRTYENRTFTVRMGTDIKDLSELMPGDAVIARFREIDDITEIAPQ